MINKNHKICYVSLLNNFNKGLFYNLIAICCLLYTLFLSYLVYDGVN